MCCTPRFIQTMQKNGFLNEHVVEYKNLENGWNLPLLSIASYVGSHITKLKSYGKFIPKKIEMVYNNSKLMTSDVLAASQSHFQVYNSATLQQNFLYADKNLSSAKILAECENTAFVTLATRITELKRILRNTAISKIFIGKEILSELKVGFYFRTWVPKFVLIRIRSVQSSGIFDWWNAIVSELDSKMNFRKIRENLETKVETGLKSRNKTKKKSSIWLKLWLNFWKDIL